MSEASARLLRAVFCGVSLVLLMPATPAVRGQSTHHYNEPFRPQFHFTPETNWMNDPNGLVYYQGEYHLFYQYNPFGNKWGHMSWAHAVSGDLIHWQSLPLALAEENGVMIFSGSAVVDWKNASGFGRDGNPPLVAVYAGNYTGRARQNQNIAYSNDRGRTWTKFAGNPVIDIGYKDFRDPKVFWHEPTQRWVMVAALSTDHKIRFYASADLKKWTLLSDFGPAGATAGVWECPDLFPLTVNGDLNRHKWVLVVNVGSGAPAGGTGAQYFVGDFDGTRFIPDVAPKSVATAATANEVVADFEGDNFGAWQVAGTAFGTGPVHPDTSVTGYMGRKLVDSYGSGDADTGSLLSPPFIVDRNYLSFLMGGGAHAGQLGMELLINGQSVKTATGNNSSSLEWQAWDVHSYAGKRAQLRIFDAYTNGDWGHIYVDQIVLGDAPAGTTAAETFWADYGPDFYASSSWSDMPAADGRRIWLGWMNNWQYGQDLPTAPWRSAMSVPRTLSLITGDSGLRLAQQPVRELDKLRTARPLRFNGGSFTQAAQWLSTQTNLPPLLDIEMKFAQVSSHSPFAVILHTGPNQQLSIACLPGRGELVVDRRESGLTGFSPQFPGKYAAPLRLVDGECSLRLLVDTSSVETFAQEGTVVLSTLFFPDAGARRLSLTAGGGGKPYVSNLTIHPLQSAWSSADDQRNKEYSISPR